MNRQTKNPPIKTTRKKPNWGVTIPVIILVAFIISSLLVLTIHLVTDNNNYIPDKKERQKLSRLADIRDLSLNHIKEHNQFPHDIKDKQGNLLCSWRLHFPKWGKGLETITPNALWKSDKYKEFRKSDYNLFCYNGSPKTNLVTIKGNGTYYDVGGNLKKPVLLLIEVSNFDKHWMEPGDITVEDLKNIIEGKSRTKLGIEKHFYYSLFSNGFIVKLKTETPFKEIRPFLTVEEAQKAEFKKFIQKYTFR
jgi:competence protein ComGC